ncbi:restriction endonuclease subunit S [Rothia nasimurium]|uniref:restriction endonuclease subunit S n=1 Tax=Rothia nasimurium TaxID=85336 RepID=UPI001628DAB6|nr:restriction endonuclease subunit S [Rothia nasimurium]
MKSNKDVPLGSLIKPAKVIKAGNGSYPILSMTMHKGLMDQNQKFKKSIASKDLSGYKVVKRGQLVVSFPIDEGVLDFQQLYDEAIVSPAYGIWDLVDIEGVDINYLGLALKSDRSLAYYKAKLQGSTARRRSLPKDVFLALPVQLPNINEQKRIVEQHQLKKLIEQKRERQQELFEELERSLFISIFGNPETWENKFEMTTIGDLAESTQYGTSAKAGATGEYPVLRMGNITDDGKLDLSDLKYMDLSPKEVEKYTVRKGDLLFNRTNSKEKVGKAAVVLTDEKLAYAGYLVRVRFKNPDHAHFVAAFLNSDYGRKLRRKLAKTAVNQANINAKELTKIPIIEPENAKIINFNNFFTL